MKSVQNAVQDIAPELFDWIEVFRVGTHIDSYTGTETTWEESDLDAIVFNFQPNTFSVPVVLGHQTSDSSPAYGWVSQLKREGEGLYAKLAHVLETFAISFKKKQYPNRSVRIDLTERGPELGHLAFLGAVPPAVDLQPALQFKRYISSHSFPVQPSTQGDSMLLPPKSPPKDEEKKAADVKAEVKSLDSSEEEEENKSASPDAAMFELAIEETPATPPPTLAKAATKPKPVAPDMVVMSAQERSALLNQGITSATEAMLANSQLYISQLQAAGKVTPALLDGLAEFMCFLARLDDPNPIFAYAASVSPNLASTKQLVYRDTTGNTVKARPIDFFKALLEKLPTQFQNTRHDYSAMPVTDPAEQFKNIVQNITAGYRKQAPTPSTPHHRGI